MYFYVMDSKKWSFIQLTQQTFERKIAIKCWQKIDSEHKNVMCDCDERILVNIDEHH